jgi:hypothetical protein
MDDEGLFKRMKQEFGQAIGWWWRWMMTRRLAAIRFVQFHIIGGLPVEIHIHSQMQDQTHEYPPPETNRSYVYSPRPVQHYTPVGHELMKHLYYCPKKCSGSTFCIERFPKHDALDVLRSGRTNEAYAWGIELIEARNWKFLWVTVSIIMLASLAAGIFWSCIRKDVSGGFTIAAYMNTLLTVRLGAAEAMWDNL